MAGTMHRPSDSLHPHGYSLDVPMFIICTYLINHHSVVRSPREEEAGQFQGELQHPHGMHFSRLQLILQLRFEPNLLQGLRFECVITCAAKMAKVRTIWNS